MKAKRWLIFPGVTAVEPIRWRELLSLSSGHPAEMAGVSCAKEPSLATIGLRASTRGGDAMQSKMHEGVLRRAITEHQAHGPFGNAPAVWLPASQESASHK